MVDLSDPVDDMLRQLVNDILQPPVHLVLASRDVQVSPELFARIFEGVCGAAAFFHGLFTLGLDIGGSITAEESFEHRDLIRIIAHIDKLMSDSTKQKQGYLREQIIEGGYDAGQFVEYLASQREHGDDVDVWSMNSLEDMVAKFRDEHLDQNSVTLSPPDTPDKQSTSMAQMAAMAQSKVSNIKDDSDDEDGTNTPQRLNTKNEDIHESSAKEEDKMEEDLIRRSRIDQSEVLQAAKSAGYAGALSETERIKKQLYEKALREKKSTIVNMNNQEYDITSKCLKNPENEISSTKNIRVMISNSKMVKGGLFSSSYVSYKIVVKPLEYVVERRYNDFLWLRNILSREYPGIFVHSI
jgi:hypothetical protein